MDDKPMYYIGVAKPSVPNFVFQGKEGSIDTLVLTPEGFIYKGVMIEDAGEAHQLFKAALSGLKAETYATQALRLIREAGQNFTNWATWAQKTAAWGMEPTKWPKQPDQPPEETPTASVVLPARLSPEMSKAGAKANSEWLNDRAPIGESRYELSMDAVYEAFQKAYEKEKKSA